MSAENNHAFIDAQNLFMGLKDLGWSVDVYRFRTYLTDKYHVTKAYWFIGFLPENQKFYDLLQDAGFHVVFKEVSKGSDGKPKGNVDVHLTLYAVSTLATYDNALLVTSDGDFAVLVSHLKDARKLKAVLSTSTTKTSFLLKRAVGTDGSLQFLNVLKDKIGRKS